MKFSYKVTFDISDDDAEIEDIIEVLQCSIEDELSNELSAPMPNGQVHWVKCRTEVEYLP